LVLILREMSLERELLIPRRHQFPPQGQTGPHSIPKLVLYAIRNEMIHLHMLDALQLVHAEHHEDASSTPGFESAAEHPIALTVQSLA
jgi:hypothetical protein